MDAQQVNLLLAALLNTWSSFITTQGGIIDLTFTDLLLNILQQNEINHSMTSKSDKSSTQTFYVQKKNLLNHILDNVINSNNPINFKNILHHGQLIVSINLVILLFAIIVAHMAINL